MQALKVLIVSSYDHSPSSVRSEGEMILGLKRAGLDIEVMTQANCAYGRRFREAGIPVIDHHPHQKIQWSTIRLMRRTLRTGKHDILHLFNSKAIGNGVWAAAGLPVKVITYRGAAGLYWHDPTAYLTHFHPRVDHIVCLSNFVERHLRRHMILARKPTTTIHKGEDIRMLESIRPASRSALGLKEEGLVVGCVANLRPVKGVEYLVDSTRRLPPGLPLQFVLVGQGTDGLALRRRIDRSPYRQRFHTLGYREDADAIIAACDIYVQPSLSEGLGKTVIQALFQGCAVIITDAGGFTEVVEDGKSGAIVPAGNAQAIAWAIETLVKKPELRRAYGQAGGDFIRQHFTVARTVQKTLDLYRRLGGDGGWGFGERDGRGKGEKGSS